MELEAADYQLVVQTIQRRFSAEQISKHKLLDKPIDERFVLELAELDLEFFCRFYLPHHFFKPPANMHRQMFLKIRALLDKEGKAQLVCVLPRGHAKTTIIALGLPLWCACFQKRYHIVIISDSLDQAKDHLKTLKHEFETNERLEDHFGNQVGATWQMEMIETAKGVLIRALGSGMKIRGRKNYEHRPDLIILDDMEELTGVESPTQRESLRKRFFRSVMKAGWGDTKVIAIGNLLHYDCLLIHLLKNPMFDTMVRKALISEPTRKDLWQEWRDIITNLEDPDKETTARRFFEAHEADMLEGAQSAWPEAFPVYDLMLVRLAEGEAAFQTELQNEPVSPEDRYFKKYYTYKMTYDDGAVWLVPNASAARVRLRDCALFAFTDPSMGQSTTADKSAICIVAKSPTNRQFVLLSDAKIRPPRQIMDRQDELATEYRITRWGIEKTAFQAFFATESARQSMEKDIYLPMVAVNQASNKALRLKSLQPDFDNAYLLLPEEGCEGLKEEIEHWPKWASDDELDALEGARTLARKWQPLQDASLIQGEVHTFGAEQPHTVEAPQDPWEQAEREAREQRYWEEYDALVAQYQGKELELAVNALNTKYPVISGQRKPPFVPITVY